MNDMMKLFIITFAATTTALNISNFISNEIDIIKNKFLQWTYHEGSILEKNHYEQICDNLNLESISCYNDCLYYLFPLILFDTLSSINESTKHNQLIKVYNWYEMSGSPIGYFSVGNPSMCKYKDGTYCSTPIKMNHGRRLVFQAHGCCVPGTCINNDAIKILKANEWCYKSYVKKYESFIDFERADIKIHNICQPLERDFSASNIGFWIISIILFIILFCVIIATIIYQLNIYTNSNNQSIFLSSFSIQNSWTLFTTKRPLNNSKFNFLDGLRFIAIVCVVFGHCSYITALGISANGQTVLPVDQKNHKIDTHPKPFEYFNSSFIWTIIHFLCNNSVNTFFYLSGLLSTHSLLKQKSIKLSYIWIPFVYLYRLLRLLPILIFALLFQLYLMDQILYGYNVTSRNDNYISCSSCWYKIIFMYQNLLNPKVWTGGTESSYWGCLGAAWYIFCDFQSFLILPWIILIFKYKQIYGFIIPLLLILICIICRIYYSIYYHLYANFNAPPYNTIHNNERFMDPYQQIYRKPWVRWSPYFIGVFIMLLISYINKEKKDFKIKSNIIYLLLMFLCFFLFYCFIIWPYQDVKNIPFNRWSMSGNQVWYSLSNSGWGVALGIMTFAFYYKTKEIYSITYTLLSMEIFQPLSKLVYIIYLFHLFVIMVLFTNSDVPVYAQTPQLIVYFFGIALVTTIIACILWFIVEKPITSLIKAFLNKIKSRNIFFNESNVESIPIQPNDDQNYNPVVVIHYYK